MESGKGSACARGALDAIKNSCDCPRNLLAKIASPGIMELARDFIDDELPACIVIYLPHREAAFSS
jgi:hypothetical protein